VVARCARGNYRAMSTSSTESPALAPNASKPHVRRYLWVVGAALYTLVVWLVGWDRLVTAIGHASLGPFAFAILIMIVAQVLRAAKWRLALGPGQHAFRAFAISKAGGEWSPGRIGEFAPLMIAKHRSARVAAWIVADRVYEIAATLGIGLGGMLLIRASHRGYMIAAVLVVIALVSVGLYTLTRHRWIEAVARRLNPGSRLRVLAFKIAAVSVELRAFARTSPLLFGVTILAGLMDVAVGYYLLASLGFVAPIPVIAAAKGLHAVTSAIPITPNATGVPYLAAAALYHEAAGVTPEALAALVAISVILSQLVLWSTFALGALDGPGAQVEPVAPRG
jgi:uncharacterized protein (TIRG00374 family)